MLGVKYISKVGPIGLVHKFNIKCERKRGLRDECAVFWFGFGFVCFLALTTRGLSCHSDGEDCKRKFGEPI